MLLAATGRRSGRWIPDLGFGSTRRELAVLGRGWSRSRTSTSVLRIAAEKMRRADPRLALTQIHTIRSVDGNAIWPHVMDEVAKSLPPTPALLAVQGAVAVADTTDTTDRPCSSDGRSPWISGYTRFLRC
jgi:hypothetical protein